MAVALSLDSMTTTDKLAAIEQLWDDLIRNPDDVPSPAWHGKVLEAREERVSKGEDTFYDLADVKERLGNKAR
ncbi:MAG: addiction module protein [Mariprofundaceae bacterium]|nr:addiction module protein [Mariprofundaceae bacterium]